MNREELKNYIVENINVYQNRRSFSIFNKNYFLEILSTNKMNTNFTVLFHNNSMEKYNSFTILNGANIYPISIKKFKDLNYYGYNELFKDLKIDDVLDIIDYIGKLDKLKAFL